MPAIPMTLALASLAMVASCAQMQTSPDASDVRDQLPVLGHRNWIVIADSAYPRQSNPGIETIYVGGDQLALVEEILAAIDAAPHVRANVYVDKELSVIDEADAPGMDAFRASLDSLLEGRGTKELLHNDVIMKLDEAAQAFNVVLLKSDMTLPYTSVFLELQCGYWDGDSEDRMRAKLN